MRPAVRVALSRAIPSPTRCRSQRRRSCSASGTSAPAGVGARRSARLGEQHEGKQAGHLRLVRELGMKQSRQPDALSREVHAGEVRTAGGGVALVEQQVEHLAHRPDPRAGVLGEDEGPAPQPRLGPADALGHRGLGHEVGRSDLPRREPRHGPQRQRDGQRRRQGVVTAQEQQHQRVVCGRDGVLVVERQRRGELLPPAARIRTPVLIDQPTGRHGDQPRQRPVRHGVRPLLRCSGERLLHRVLGTGEVAVPASDGAEGLRSERAQQTLDVRRGHTSGSGAPSTCRTSICCCSATPPGPGEADDSAAISSARSSDSTSMSR